MTSRPNRTSPVLRGKWILENVLGHAAAEPPPDVPALQENDAGNHDSVVSVRERLAQHRANAVCAGCHAMIDPPGFALENFDAVRQVAASGTSRRRRSTRRACCPTARSSTGSASFRATLLKDPDVFATTVTRKLMTYALGRGLEPYDMPAVRRIVARGRARRTQAVGARRWASCAAFRSR